MSAGGLFTTSGRRMSRSLQAAIDGLGAEDRRRAIEALSASDGPVLGRLMRAVAVELGLAALREAHTLAGLEEDLAGPVDLDLEPPWPAPPDGAPLRFDPDSPV